MLCLCCTAVLCLCCLCCLCCCCALLVLLSHCCALLVLCLSACACAMLKRLWWCCAWCCADVSAVLCLCCCCALLVLLLSHCCALLVLLSLVGIGLTGVKNRRHFMGQTKRSLSPMISITIMREDADQKFWKILEKIYLFQQSERHQVAYIHCHSGPE